MVGTESVTDVWKAPVQSIFGNQAIMRGGDCGVEIHCDPSGVDEVGLVAQSCQLYPRLQNDTRLRSHQYTQIRLAHR